MAAMFLRMSLAAALLALAGCGGDQPEGPRLTVTVAGSPASREGGPQNSLAADLAAEATGATLIAQGSGGDLLPGLASSWRFVDDGRALILRLKPVRWSDGEPLEAKQVVASLRKAAGRGEPALLASDIVNADRVSEGDAPAARLGALAPIARVVELRLEAPAPLLLAWLADPGLAVTRPAPRASKGDKAPAPPTLAPYAAAGPPERQVLKRRRREASPDARPAEITIAAEADTGAAITSFTAGKSDIVIGEGLAGLGEARAVPPRDALRLDPLWGVYGYRANVRTGPLANPATRRALSLAVDRAALAGSFGLAAIEPAPGLVPRSLGLIGLPVRSGVAERIARVTGRTTATDAGLLPGLPGVDADRETALATARTLLAEAGWTAEQPLRLVLLVPQGRDHARVAEAVAADWASVGVQLTVRALSPAQLAARIEAGDYDLAAEEASVPAPDAAALLSRYRCGAGIVCNPVADLLLAEARRAGPAARPVLLARAEAEWMAAPPLIPLFTPVRWALVSRQVDGWLPNRAGRHPLGRLAVK
jgi:ABC-type transport system substrate-binding protein